MLKEPLIKKLVPRASRRAKGSRIAILSVVVPSHVNNDRDFHRWFEEAVKSRLKAGLGMPEYDVMSITENYETIWER